MSIHESPGKPDPEGDLRRALATSERLRLMLQGNAKAQTTLRLKVVELHEALTWILDNVYPPDVFSGESDSDEPLVQWIRRARAALNLSERP